MNESSQKKEANNINKKEKFSYSIQEQEKIIKFYLINEDIYYLFIKNKNEIKIISSTELVCSFTLYHFNVIQDFIVTPIVNSLILCTSKDISLYNLQTRNNKKELIKINYILFKKIPEDNTIHLSFSILGDIFISLNSFYTIKIFDMKLNNLKSINVDKSFLPQNINFFPLDSFLLNYDTKTILLSKYGYNKFNLIYKQTDIENENEYNNKIISINENIISIKEYEKDLDIYTNYKGNSVLLILTEDLNFLIVQRVFEENMDDNNYKSYSPNIRTLLYINLSSYTEIKNYYYLSFSFFINNLNVINKNNENIPKNIKSGIIDMEYWEKEINKYDYEENFTYLNYESKYLKEINYDYLMINFSEKVIIYKIEGLKLSNYNNPSLVEYYSAVIDNRNKNNFTLLNIIKGLDNNFNIFYIDKFNNIHKFYLKIISEISNDNSNTKNINSNKKSNNSIDLKKISKKNLNELNIMNESNNINKNQSNTKLIAINKNINNNFNSENLKSTSVKDKNKKNNKANLHKKREISNNFEEKSLIEKETQEENEIKKTITIKPSSIFYLFKNIIYAEFSIFHKLTMIYQKIETNSVISFLDNDYSVEKILIFENMEIFNLIWIKNTNFIMFYYIKKNLQNSKDMPILVIINIFSKFLNQKENYINDAKIKNLFIYVNMNAHFKLNIKIHKINIESNLDSINVDNLKIKNKSFLNISKDKNIINNNSNDTISKDFNSNKNNFKVPIRIPQPNNNESTFSFYILLKTDFSLYNLLIKIIKLHKGKEYGCEIKNNFVIKQKSLILSKYDLLNWNKKEFIFNSNEIFYTSYNENSDFISINKINKNLVNKKIFESILLEKIICIYYYNNNYIVYVNKIYINIYDIKNRTFYRIQNEYISNEGEKILFFSYNFHLYLIILSTHSIILINLINQFNNIINFEFKYFFDIGKFYLINLINDSLIINDSQIISNLNENIIKKNSNNSFQLIKLLSSNIYSIFDKRTFLDNYLDDNENTNKIIFNIFLNKYYKSKKEKNLNYCFQNSKIIPNIFENLEIIKNVLFEGNLKNSNNNLNSIIKLETDSLKIKDFHNFINKNQKLNFINYLYDLIYNEKFKNNDNITKYFMLKYYSIINNNFKLSSSDLCWLSIINNQTEIINFITQGNISNITWEKMKKYNIPLWIKSETKLKELLLEVAKNKYKEDTLNKYKNNTNKTENNNFTENVALYLYLSGNMNILYNYFDKEPQNEKIKKFIMRDFSVKKNRKAAHENANSLFNKKKFIYAAFFYLLADDVRSSLDMIYEKMHDINLTICILKLVKNKKESDYLKYYSISKIYTELFIKLGILFRDPYLVTFGYIGQEKYDLALEYILNYNDEYSLNEIKENLENNENLNILKNSLSFSVFDYKMILFAKKLEKFYHLKYEENDKNIQNLVNTDFNENDWDMDALNDSEENGNTGQNNENKNKEENSINQEEYKIKKINIDYNNLEILCLKNSSINGNNFISNINILSKINNNMKIFHNLIRNNLKNMIIARIILDSIYLTSSYNINKNYKNYKIELNNFSEYLLRKSIINHKYELHFRINDTCLLFNLYKSMNILPINIYNNKQKSKILKSIEIYFESMVNKVIYDLLPFNNYQINNLLKIEDILFKYNHLFVYLVRFIRENKNGTIYLNTLYILRIILTNILFLIFVYKLFLKYNKISIIFEEIQKLNNEQDNITKIPSDKLIELIEALNNKIIKLLATIKKIKLKEKKIIIEEGLIFYIYFLNFSINKQLQIFLQNENIKKISYYKCIISNSSPDINYFHIDNYHLFFDILKKIQLNISTFDFYIKKYITKNLNCVLSYAIYEELKNIYINRNNINYINDEKSNHKTIKFEKVFYSKEKNKFFDKIIKFENNFKLGEIIRKNLSNLSINFKYEKNKENILNNQANITNISLPSSSISSKSIQIINNIYKTGYEICNFNNEIKLKDFCFNNCDSTQLSLSFKEKGNIKINIIDKILKKIKIQKDSTELDTINNWVNSYEESLEKDYNYLFDFKLKQYNYDNIIPILYQNLINPKYCNKYNNLSSLFREKLIIPPNNFNGIQSNSYLEDISLFCPPRKSKFFSSSVNSTIYSDILVSHPQLPLYLSSNDTGVIFLYSFSQKDKISKIIDEFYISNNDSNINHFINKIKFNFYGDNFMACDTDGNLYNWNFDHIQSRKIPQNIIHNNPENNINFICNDMCYLNNTGVIAAISEKSLLLFDLLMPPKKRKIKEIFFGGNIILPKYLDKYFIISNNDFPGTISFFDIRKMEVIKNTQLYNINKNLNEKNNEIRIMDMKLSESENYLVTYGSNYCVNIWDLTQNQNPLLIDSLEPFNLENKDINIDEKNFRGKLELSSGFLFASKDNNIKLLRNNII